jgi:hypothetical protein
MHGMSKLELVGRYFTAEESRSVASEINTGRTFDVGFFDAASAKALLSELLSLQSTYVNLPWPFYNQILVARAGAIVAWGTNDRQDACQLDLDPYPLLRRLLSNLLVISDALRCTNEELLLSVLPALRRTRPSPRFYHRESHTSLGQCEAEGATPTLYRMCCDLGLENSCDVINVDLVRRDRMLEPDGTLSRRWWPLFQQQYIDYGKSDSIEDVAQEQLTEEMLAFPGEKPKLLPGRAFIWNDDLYFHSPYLRNGHSLDELIAEPRSIVVINEFCHNKFRQIEWSHPAKDILERLIKL